MARNQAEMRAAATNLANGMRAIGVGNVPGFVADARTRARDPATIAAVARKVGGATPAKAPRPSPANNPQQKFDIARKLVQPGNDITSADVAVMVQHLASTMSLSQLRKMQSVGVHVIVCRGSVTEYLAYLKGSQPRGYLPGQTWDTIPGTLSQNNEVVVATHTGSNGERVLPGPKQSASADVTLHEVGHVINRKAGVAGDLASNGNDFKRAYDQDAQKGSLADSYYHQKDTVSGRDEAFAESHAEFIRDPNAMRAQYPHLYAYWQHYYGAEK
jgi:hypothetical protein